jgi:hypothetical protein
MLQGKWSYDLCSSTISVALFTLFTLLQSIVYYGIQALSKNVLLIEFLSY